MNFFSQLGCLLKTINLTLILKSIQKVATCKKDYKKKAIDRKVMELLECNKTFTFVKISIQFWRVDTNLNIWGQLKELITTQKIMKTWIF
jgi:hypothetical protein